VFRGGEVGRIRIVGISLDGGVASSVVKEAGGLIVSAACESAKRISTWGNVEFCGFGIAFLPLERVKDPNQELLCGSGDWFRDSGFTKVDSVDAGAGYRISGAGTLLIGDSARGRESGKDQC